MKKFVLKSKLGEIIALKYANDLDDANKLFALIKNLKINDLLRIFIIEETV